MSPGCAREVLQAKFNEWLKARYNPEALALVDLQTAAELWVAEGSTFVTGVGQCLIEKCGRCGQSSKVLESGNISMIQEEPKCEVAPQPAIVPIYEFNKQ